MHLAARPALTSLRPSRAYGLSSTKLFIAFLAFVHDSLVWVSEAADTFLAVVAQKLVRSALY